MLIDIALLFLAFFLAIPLVTGYFAYSHGRSFWLWFMIGCFLPVISNLLLIGVIKTAEKFQKDTAIAMNRDEEEHMEEQIRNALRPSTSRRDLS